ncbi:MAG: amidohydrolase, partial [Pyramidobacter sp.]|nr:amidohydrolase [Pyramidobacter sp.]
GCIKGVGAEHTILSTDLGQAARQTSGEGMKLFRELLAAEGISQAELDLMSADNPRHLLGL